MSQFQGLSVPEDVIRSARAGDARAHETIFRICRGPVYTLIRRLIPRAAVADDLFQDTFVEILKSIHNYSGEGSFAGWVRSIAVSKCLMYLRSPWHRSLLWLEDEHETRELVGAQSAEAELGHDDLSRALEELPALTRTVVWLYDVEGYTHPEIARLLGRTISFSKSQLARAHARLRSVLRAEPVTEARRTSSDGVVRDTAPMARLAAFGE